MPPRWRSRGFLRSEMMLDAFGVDEAHWRDALDPGRGPRGLPTAPPDFARSESPRFVGRAVAALAADPDRARWNQRSVTSGGLAHADGFTELVGSRPDVWRSLEVVGEPGADVDRARYR
jgi:hypothetical protein